MFYISSEVCRTKGQSKWKMYVFFFWTSQEILFYKIN